MASAIVKLTSGPDKLYKLNGRDPICGLGEMPGFNGRRVTWLTLKETSNIKLDKRLNIFIESLFLFPILEHFVYLIPFSRYLLAF